MRVRIKTVESLANSIRNKIDYTESFGFISIRDTFPVKVGVCGEISNISTEFSYGHATQKHLILNEEVEEIME